MIDLLPYLEQLSKEDLMHIGKKYVNCFMDIKRLARTINNNLSREKLYNELFNSGRDILIEGNLLKDITEEFHISDKTYSYLSKKVFSINPMVRTNAIKLLLKHHPQNAVKILSIIIKKEGSSYVISNIWKELENSPVSYYHEMLNYLLSRLSKLWYDIDPLEIKVLLDITKRVMSLNMCGSVTLPLFMERFDEWLHSFGDNPTEIQYKELLNSKVSLSISRNHIVGLKIDIASITRSILHLTKLKWLLIFQSDDKKYEIPEILEILEKLPELQYIYIGSVNLVKIPQWIKEKVRKHLSKKYIKQGVVEKDAFVLGLIEILVNREIPSVEWLVSEGWYGDDTNSVLEYSQYHYNKNEFGKVTAIRIVDYDINVYYLHIIPDEINTLDALEELTISCYFLRIVPDSIKNLPNLKKALIVRSHGSDFKVFLNTDPNLKVRPVYWAPP